jgi:hypothetical protein
MKRFLSRILIIIGILLAINTSVEAQGKPELLTKLMVQVNDRSSTEYPTPFELVGRAYQGRYRMQSIPGFSSLIYGVKIGKITAKNLVKAAIDTQDLPPQAISNRDYLRNVNWQLGSI